MALQDMNMKPDGYLLSEKSVRQVRDSLYTHARRILNQRYTQADDKIDHEEFHTTEFHIARTPEGGIPALQSMGSTGIDDIPGSAECYAFKSTQYPSSLDIYKTDVVGALKLRVLNLSDSVIEENQWVLIIRDKYGQWYAINPAGTTTSPPPVPPSGIATGPGWVAGLSNEDCLQLTVLGSSGKCSTIDITQTLILRSDDGETWESATNFQYSGGFGIVEFTRPVGQSMPNLVIGGYDLIYDGAGILDGEHYIDFAGGTSLCSDVPGSGSGTGGPREACGGNTFIVRLMCFAYCDAAPCVDDDGLGTTALRSAWSDETVGATCLPDTRDSNSVGYPGPWSWSTISCEGNIGYSLECVDDLWVLTLPVGFTSTVVSYESDPAFELVYNVSIPANALGTGTPSATATLTITKVP